MEFRIPFPDLPRRVSTCLEMGPREHAVLEMESADSGNEKKQVKRESIGNLSLFPKLMLDVSEFWVTQRKISNDLFRIASIKMCVS